MSALAHRYDQLREQGHTYATAVKSLARELEVDDGTVVRALNRCDRPGFRERGPHAPDFEAPPLSGRLTRSTAAAAPARPDPAPAQAADPSLHERNR
jgi:hypothetical protein